MPDERAHELALRLRKAEEAASYMERLETLASEAPTLREQVSLLQRMEERENHRREAIENARYALNAAAEAQGELPDLIANAANLVSQLARALREVDTFRREATTALSVVDRMDYEDELDRAMEEQEEEDPDAPIQRDAQSIRMLVASRHGSARVRRMIDELSPGFEVFAGCNLDADPMRGELTTLIMAKLAAEAEASRGPAAVRRPTPPPPQMTEPAVPIAQENADPAGG